MNRKDFRPSDNVSKGLSDKDRAIIQKARNNDNVKSQKITERLNKVRDKKMQEGMSYNDATIYASNHYDSGITLQIKKTDNKLFENYPNAMNRKTEKYELVDNDNNVIARRGSVKELKSISEIGKENKLVYGDTSWKKSYKYDGSNPQHYTIYTNDESKYKGFENAYYLSLGRVGNTNQYSVNVTREGEQVESTTFESRTDAQHYAQEYMKKDDARTSSYRKYLNNQNYVTGKIVNNTKIGLEKEKETENRDRKKHSSYY